MFESVDWTKRGQYMHRKHGITPRVANDALGDASRVLIEPDYDSTSGDGIRVIGYSTLADDIITVTVLEHEGIEYGVNGWSAKAKGSPHLQLRQLRERRRSR